MKFRPILPLLAILLLGDAASAGLSPGQRAEIDHLLNFVRQSNCKMFRNGKLYGGVAAAAHIEKKFDYYLDEIHSTEKFVELSATRSLLSGKFYMVRCGDGDRIRARDWLLRELADFRRRGEN